MPGDGRVPFDLAFTRWMAVEHGVVMIPLSFFFEVGSENTIDNFVRLSIAKLPHSIEKCVEKLK